MQSTDDPLADLAAAPFPLPDLIDYQDDAIVSRALIDEESATLTAFALDEGQRISEHSAPHDAVLQVVDGTATVTLDGTDHELTAGEAIAMQANVPHAVAAPARFKMLLTMVR